MQRFNGKLSAHVWLNGAAALWIATLCAGLLSGCQGFEESGDDNVQDCFAVQLYGRNPDTGACDLAPVTCPQRVPGSTEWQLPEGWLPCDAIPPDTNACANLDEYSCAQTPGCEPLFRSLNGEDGANTRPATGESWGFAFAGCYEQIVRACESLDEQACYATPGCSPIYGAAPCDCSGAAPGPNGDAEYIPPSDCACAAIAQFIGCETLPPPPPSCYETYDEYSCLSVPGCHWVYTDGTSTDPSTGADKICFCEDPTSPDCVCGGAPMPPPSGYCEPDVVVYPCNYTNPEECLMDRSCEWVDAQGNVQDPMPCTCAPGEACDCGGSGAMPEPWGYCQVSSKPQSCYDSYDEYSCWSIPGCEWIYQGGNGSEDCACLEGDPNCGCGGFAAWGYCQPTQFNGCWNYYDEYSCSNDPACAWYSDGTDGGDFAPCMCDPSYPDCGCTQPVPPPSGYCGDRFIEPTGCANYYDEYSCSSDPACAWAASGGIVEPCDCDPSYPDCGCAMPEPWGYCYDAPPKDDCAWFADEYSCISTPGCAWASSGGEAPIAPCVCPDGTENCDTCGGGNLVDQCWGAWTDQNGLCRGPADEVLPDDCCARVEPPPPAGYCYAQTVDPCADLLDERSCWSIPGCTWLPADGARPIMPPPCDDPADPNCGVSMCEGALLDASGACVLPDGQYAPPECCPTNAGVCVGF